MNLYQKNVFITGGTSGLGLEIAKLCLSKGAKVNVIGKTLEAVDSVNKEFQQSGLRAFQCDVANYSGLAAIAKDLDPVDVLINNAGVMIEGYLENLKPESIAVAINTNLIGLIYATQIFLPFMKTKNSGVILNVSSTAGLRGKSKGSVYSASKFGVRGFTEALKEELKDTEVRVLGFYPGGMQTNFFVKNNPSDERNMSKYMLVENVAPIVIDMLEKSDTVLMDEIIVNRIKN